MKRISILSSLPPIKWISAYTVPFLQELEKNIQVNFFWFKDIYPEFLYPDGTKNFELQSPSFFNTDIKNQITWYNPISWIRTWFQIQTDVHAQWWSWVLAPIYWIVLWIAKLRWKQIILTIHNVSPHEKSFVKTFFNNIIYKLWDKFIVHSESNKQELQRIIWDQKQIEVIPHGIITPNFQKDTKENLRKKYNLKMNEKIILFYWNIRDYKWLDIILFAFSKIIKNQSNFKLIIAWPCWQEWEKYQKIVDENNLNNSILRIDWFIWEQQTWELFTLSDLLVLPYRNFDSQSWVIATNLCFNLPVIVSNLWWLTEVIQDKDLIFEVENIEELEEKITNIFTWDKLQEKKQYLSSLKEKFEWQHIVKKTLEFYKK